MQNELNALHHRSGVTALMTNQDQSEMTELAKTWAARKGIPVVNEGKPRIIVIAGLLTSDELEGMAKEAGRILQGLKKRRPPQGPLARLTEWLRTKEIIWINTKHGAYLRPEEEK